MFSYIFKNLANFFGSTRNIVQKNKSLNTIENNVVIYNSLLCVLCVFNCYVNMSALFPLILLFKLIIFMFNISWYPSNIFFFKNVFTLWIIHETISSYKKLCILCCIKRIIIINASTHSLSFKCRKRMIIIISTKSNGELKLESNGFLRTLTQILLCTTRQYNIV